MTLSDAQLLSLRDRVNLGAVTMKGYSTFPKAPALLEPHPQIVLYHIQETHGRGGLTLQRCRLYSTTPAN